MLVVLATSVLPGCLTQALWQDELFRPGVRELTVQLVSEQTVVLDGQLEVRSPHPGAEPQLQFRGGGDGDPAPLRPDARDGVAAGAAPIVWLLASDSCDITGSRLLVERQKLLGEGFAQQADLELELRPRAARLGAEVAASEVPPRVRERLDADVSRFAFELADFGRVTLAGQCRQRLTAVDLAALLHSSGPVTVDRVAFCDEEGRPSEPRRPPVATDLQSDEGQWITEIAEDEQLERDLAVLTGQTMWAVVHCGGQRRYLRFAAGELWLVCAGERRGDRLVHRSRWRSASPLPAGQGQLLAVLPCTTVRHEVFLSRSEESFWGRVPSDGLPAWEKALLTPFTLAVDIVFQAAWRYFLPWRQYDSDHGVGRGR